MDITQLELETVTPMFLRGADNRTPEPPSTSVQSAVPLLVEGSPGEH